VRIESEKQTDMQALAEVVRTIKSGDAQMDELLDSMLVVRDLLKIQNELLSRLPGSLQATLRGYTGG
jgi:hypothetical protein